MRPSRGSARSSRRSRSRRGWSSGWCRTPTTSSPRSAGRSRAGSSMASEVKLPRLGQGMESGTIVRWLNTEGDAVTKGEPLFELDTDKVTQEVEAESDGVLLKIVIADGEVDVGTTVGIIGAQDEDVAALLAGSQGGNGDAPSAAAAAAAEPASKTAVQPPPTDVAPASEAEV